MVNFSEEQRQSISEAMKDFSGRGVIYCVNDPMEGILAKKQMPDQTDVSAIVEKKPKYLWISVGGAMLLIVGVVLFIKLRKKK